MIHLKTTFGQEITTVYVPPVSPPPAPEEPSAEPTGGTVIEGIGFVSLYTYEDSPFTDTRAHHIHAITLVDDFGSKSFRTYEFNPPFVLDRDDDGRYFVVGGPCGLNGKKCQVSVSDSEPMTWEYQTYGSGYVDTSEYETKYTDDDQFTINGKDARYLNWDVHLYYESYPAIWSETEEPVPYTPYDFWEEDFKWGGPLAIIDPANGDWSHPLDDVWPSDWYYDIDGTYSSTYEASYTHGERSSADGFESIIYKLEDWMEAWDTTWVYDEEADDSDSTYEGTGSSWDVYEYWTETFGMVNFGTQEIVQSTEITEEFYYSDPPQPEYIDDIWMDGYWDEDYQIALVVVEHPYDGDYGAFRLLWRDKTGQTGSGDIMAYFDEDNFLVLADDVKLDYGAPGMILRFNLKVSET